MARDHPVGVALRLQNLAAAERVILGARPSLVVEVVQQRDDAPLVLVCAELARIAADSGFDGKRVLQQALTLRVLGEQRPGIVTSKIHRYPQALAHLSSGAFDDQFSGDSAGHGDRDSARYGVQARTRTLRLDHGRRRLHDRIRHLHRLGGHGENDRQRRLAPGGLDAQRRPDDRRRAVVRRAGRDDAAGRRAVRLPARGLLADLGIPLRLDAVPGDSNGDDRGGRRRLRPLLRCAVSLDQRGSLPHRADSPDVGLRALRFDDSARRHPADRPSDVDEHARPRVRAHRPERLHDRQDRRAHRVDRRRPAARLERCRRDRQLRRVVDGAETSRRSCRACRR